VRKILESVQKAGGGLTRPQIENEVRAGAELIAKQDKIPVEAAEAKIWKKGGAELYQAYDVAKVGKPRQADRGTMKVTPAEAKMDTLAKKLMKATGQSNVESMGMVLQQRPDLYQQYEIEKANGQVFEVPDSLESRGFAGTQAGQKRKSGDMADFDADGDEDEDEDAAPDPTKRGKRKPSGDMLARR
jgi:hypothetical protein